MPPDPSPTAPAPPDAADVVDVEGLASANGDAWLSVAEAARQLGVSRARVYALLDAGQLDGIDAGEGVRVTAASVERRRAREAATGAPLSTTAAWAVLALASGDPAFVARLAGLLAPRDRARAKARLQTQGLLGLAPRLEARGVARRFQTTPAAVAALGADAGVVLTGVPATRALDWDLGQLDEAAAPVVDGYLSELRLVDLIEQFELDADPRGAVVLRAVREPWPFPPHVRVAPPVVVALDLAEADDAAMRAAGQAQLGELVAAVIPTWRPRSPRKPTTRPALPTGYRSQTRLAWPAEEEPWDDRLVADARHLVALLFVAGKPLPWVAAAQQLRISAARLAAACAYLGTALPRLGLALEEHQARLTLVSAGDCAPVVERYLQVPAPEPLSSAALQVLAIVAYEQPVTRADIERIRGVESGTVVDTLLSRGLLAEDRRGIGRGSPVPLVTTEGFLRTFGLSSLADLPPLVTAQAGAR